MKSAQLKLKLTFFFIFLCGLVFLINPISVEALVDCCPVAHCADLAYCSTHLLDCCYPPECRYADWTDTSMSACQENLGSPNPYCCRQSSCSGTECGTIRYWDWCHASSCQVIAHPREAGCQYRYQYTYTSCGAVDSCIGKPYLEAGICDDGSCTVGGDYKTCCSETTGEVVDCIGGQFSGVCPAGSYPVKECVGPQCCTQPTPTPGGDDGDDGEESCPGVCCTTGTCNDPMPGPNGGWDSECDSWVGGDWDRDCRNRAGCGARCCTSCGGDGDEEDEHSAAWLEAKVFKVSGVTETYEVPEDDCGGGIPPVNVSPGDQIGFTLRGWIRDMNSSSEPAGPITGNSQAKVRAFFYFGGTGLAFDVGSTHGLLYHQTTPYERGDADNAPIEIIYHDDYSGVRMRRPSRGDSEDFHARVAHLYSECGWVADLGRYPDCVNRDFGVCHRCCDYGEDGNDCGSTCEGSGNNSGCDTKKPRNPTNSSFLTFCSLKYNDGTDSYDSKDYFELGWDDYPFLEIRGEGAGQTFCVEGKFAPEQAEDEDTGKICFLIGPSGLTPIPTPTPTTTVPSPTPTPFKGPVCTF